MKTLACALSGRNIHKWLLASIVALAWTQYTPAFAAEPIKIPKTSIDSDKAQTKHAAFGWTREAWVFVNGKQVFADKNLYQPPASRKAPDGRLSLENGGFDLPLQKGHNEIAIALANNFYGWGIEMRLDDLKGVKVPDSKGLAMAKK
jgi:hypothetical protein